VSLWAVYGAGLLFFGWIGWSLRFVSFGGYLAIPILGGLYFVLLGLAFRGFRGKWRNPLLWGLLWMGLEYLRGHAPGISYPLGQVVHSVVGLGFFRAPAGFVGEAGLGGLFAFLAASLLSLFQKGRRTWGLGGTSVALLLFMVSWLSLPVSRGGAGSRIKESRIKIALCQTPEPVYRDQPGYEERRDVQARIRSFAGFVKRHREEWKDCSLVVFPESAFPFTLSKGRAQRLAKDLIAGVRPGVPLLIGAGVQGARSFPGQKFPPRFNAAVLFSPQGKILGQVAKRWLVPLGETLPGMALLSAEARDTFLGMLEGWFGLFLPSVSPGTRPGLLELPNQGEKIRLAVGICFENAFPEAFQLPADLLIVLSNEAWYRGGATLDQMLALSRLRALEAGKPLLRSTIDGWTAWIQPTGAIGALLPLEQEGVLLAEFPLGSEEGRGGQWGLCWGPWFGRLGILCLFWGWILAFIFRKGKSAS
jgi:apolipoprotein N-acyltransferase